MGRITKNELAPKLKRQIDESTHFMSNPYIHTHATLEDIPRTFGDVFNYDESNQKELIIPQAIATKLDYISSKYGTFPEEKINGLCVVDAHSKQIAIYCEDGWYVNGKKILLITDFITDKKDNECAVNDIVNFTILAQGDGNLTYKYVVTDPDTKKSYTIKDYSKSNNCQWSATKAGVKLLTTYLKSTDELNNNSIVSKSIYFTVLPNS